MDVGSDEWALWDDPEILAADVGERACDQVRADALALKLSRHLGVREGDDTARAAILRDGRVATNLHFIAAGRLVMPDLNHLARRLLPCHPNNLVAVRATTPPW